MLNDPRGEPRMDTNRHELLLKEEVYQIVGCAIEVLNTLGHGLLEKPYENALAVEFGLRGIPCMQQCHYPVMYKSFQVGEYVPDLIAFSQVIVETKTIERITDTERGQVINYLKITGLRVGLILNFKRAKLEWERLIV
jgi:GxxExxY protein